MSDKFALFGSKMPSASGGLCPPDQGLCPWTPGPHIGSRSRAHHILSVPILFPTGNEPCQLHMTSVTTATARLTAKEKLSPCTHMKKIATCNLTGS